MKTDFTLQQLQDPCLEEVDKIVKRCFHCGLCNATCPTYILLSDERNGPRGRIYMMKNMFERNNDVSSDMMRYVDRCLSCLSCMTTCPANVEYRNLIDRARDFIQERGSRPWQERVALTILAAIILNPGRFSLVLRLASYGRPLINLIRIAGLKQLAAAFDIISKSRSFRNSSTKGGKPIAISKLKYETKVLMLAGCELQVLRPVINDAAIRLLSKRGVKVEVTSGSGCCGSLMLHMGFQKQAFEFAKSNVDIWWKSIQDESVDAIITTTSDCSATIKNYAYKLKNIDGYDEKIQKIADKAMDITEFLSRTDIGPSIRWSSLKVAYHASCTMVHGQQIIEAPKKLLKNAGFTVVEIPEQHICCGSQGIYRIMQPEIAKSLHERKVLNISKVKPDIVATGSIGCIDHIGLGGHFPVVHVVELLDWAYGGPVPEGLSHFESFIYNVPTPPGRTMEDYLSL
ncbi:MAG TPA: Lactate utilization protein A [Hyphomicrobiaceae bacterium MAG_BT-2024]